MKTCERRVINKDPEPIYHKDEICGRNATHELHGQLLCERHYNKSMRKIQKRLAKFDS